MIIDGDCLTSCKCIVNIVERNSIYRMNVFDVVFLNAMTLEGKLPLLYLGVEIKVFDSHSALDRAHHVALLVGEYANCARLILEGRFASHQNYLHVSQIPDENLPLRRGHHNLLVDHTHRIHSSVALFVRSNALFFPSVPDLYRFVPTPRHDPVHFGRIFNAFNSVRMGAEHLLGLRVPIVVLQCIVQAATHRMNGTLHEELHTFNP